MKSFAGDFKALENAFLNSSLQAVTQSVVGNCLIEGSLKHNRQPPTTTFSYSNAGFCIFRINSTLL